jgi:hypothetical protein
VCFLLSLILIPQSSTASGARRSCPPDWPYYARAADNRGVYDEEPTSNSGVKGRMEVNVAFGSEELLRQGLWYAAMTMGLAIEPEGPPAD